MIRVNLLRNRKEGLQRLVSEPGGASSFISGREVLLAAVFLALGGAILWFVLGNQVGSDPAVASGNLEASSSPSEPAANPRPTAAAASGAPRATVPLPPSATSGRGAVSVATPPTAVAPQVASAPPPDAAPSSTAAPASAGRSGGPRGSTLLSGRSAAAPVASGAASRTVPAVPARSSGVITMRELRILGQGNALQIIAATDGQPEYNMFRVDNPDRVVIDLPGVRHEIAREYREQGLSNSIVKAVRVAQNQIEPPMVRLVLEVEAFPELQILSRPDGLLINVTGK